MTTIIDLARIIDPEAWAEADNFGQGAEAATPQMRPFFENQIQRLTKKSVEAAIRVVQVLTPDAVEPEIEGPDGEIPFPEVIPHPKPNRKTRRATK